MATWVCPFCDSRMLVKSAMLGKKRECLSCKMESEVTDADAEPEPVELPELPFVSSTPKLRRGKYVGPAGPIITAASAAENPEAQLSQASLPSVALAQVVLVIASLGSVLLIVASFGSAPNPAALFSTGLTGIVSVIITWPIYTIANEAYRSRLILEEILRRQK